MLRLVIRAYCAPEAVGDCARHSAAHARVLERYGIGNITSAKHAWWTNPNTYVLLLQDRESAEPLGGIRLQRWGNGVELPLEGALGGVDSRVHAWIASFAAGGVGELCGLWCSPRVKGYGLGTILTQMGLSIASRLGTMTLFALCDARNVPSNRALGFSVDTTLADAGTFEYPRPGLVAHVLRVANSFRLGSAEPEHRSSINFYRDVPLGSETLRQGATQLQLSRDLRLGPPDAQMAPVTRRRAELARCLEKTLVQQVFPPLWRTGAASAAATHRNSRGTHSRSALRSSPGSMGAPNA